jgi:hypothetical protein
MGGRIGSVQYRSAHDMIQLQSSDVFTVVMWYSFPKFTYRSSKAAHRVGLGPDFLPSF